MSGAGEVERAALREAVADELGHTWRMSLQGRLIAAAEIDRDWLLSLAQTAIDSPVLAAVRAHSDDTAGGLGESVIAECDAVGLAHDVDILIRYHRLSAAMDERSLAARQSQPSSDGGAEAEATALERYADWCLAEVSNWDESVYPNRWDNARERAQHARTRAAAVRAAVGGEQ